MAKRLERALLGMVMTVIAFIIERRILKAIRSTGKEPVHAACRSRVRRGGEAGQAGLGPRSDCCFDAASRVHG
jgi:hypothetical protein